LEGLLIKCGNGRLIDVGWYGAENGYCIYVVENGDWERPVYKFERLFRFEYIDHYLQMAINFETAVFAPPAQAPLNQIAHIIDRRTVCKGALDDMANLLERLQEAGLNQKEAENYVMVYAIRYRNDKERRNIACDILNLISLSRL
jgi:hypothetical protein